MSKAQKQDFLFLMQYMLGEYEHVLKEKFKYHYELTKGLKELEKIEPLKAMRDYTLLRNSLIYELDKVQEVDNQLEYVNNIAKGLGIDVVLEYHPIVHELQKTYEGVNLSVNELYNMVACKIGEVIDDAYALLFEGNEEYGKEVAMTQYTRVLRLGEFLDFVKVGQKNTDLNNTFVLCSSVKDSVTTCRNDVELVNYLNNVSPIKIDKLPDAFNWESYGIMTEGVEVTYEIEKCYYVDCDNIKFENFLKLLSRLQTGVSVEVKMFVDEISASYWSHIPSGTYGDVELTNIHVPRLLGKKSVVDQVLLGTLIRDNYKSSVVVSSDSDYFSLSQLGVNYSVLLESDSASDVYIMYLKNEQIPYEEMSYLESYDVYKPLIEGICKAQCVKHLSTLNIASWEEGVLVCYLTLLMQAELAWNVQIEDDYAQELSRYILGNISVINNKGSFELSLDDIRYTVV